MFGNLFRKESKKEDFNDDWKSVIRIMEILKVEITQLKKEVEIINGKLRSKLYKDSGNGGDSKDEGADQSSGSGKAPITDGFDELRELRKTF